MLRKIIIKKKYFVRDRLTKLELDAKKTSAGRDRSKRTSFSEPVSNSNGSMQKRFPSVTDIKCDLDITTI